MAFTMEILQKKIAQSPPKFMSSSAGPDDQILPLQDLHLFSPSRRRSHVGISIEVFTM